MSVDPGVYAAVASGVAAIASWASVALSYRTIRAANTPQISIHPVPSSTRTGGLGLVVHNAGGGAALNIMMIATTHQDYSAGGPPGSPVLAPNERAEIDTLLAAPPVNSDIHAVVAYSTPAGGMFLVDPTGRRKRVWFAKWRLRMDGEGWTAGQLWKRMYPEVSLGSGAADPLRQRLDGGEK